MTFPTIMFFFGDFQPQVASSLFVETYRSHADTTILAGSPRLAYGNFVAF